MIENIVFLFPSSASTEATAPRRILIAAPLCRAGYAICFIGPAIIPNWHPSFFPTLSWEASRVDYVVRRQDEGALFELVQPAESRSTSDSVARHRVGVRQRDSPQISAMRWESSRRDRRMGVGNG